MEKQGEMWKQDLKKIGVLTAGFGTVYAIYKSRYSAKASTTYVMSAITTL